MEYSIGDIGTGYLGWPEKHNYRSKPLAGITLIDDTDGVNSLTKALESLTITNRDYPPSYKVLVPGQSYTVVGVGKGDYRKKQYIYAKLSNGQRIRCGKSLTELILSEGSGNSFTFVVDRIVNHSGVKDAICFKHML